MSVKQTDTPPNIEPFTMVPNYVITADIPDGLFRLITYCYSNKDTFRYNVPHLMDVLQRERRILQMYIRTLNGAGVLIPTTSEKVKHGYIPNYLFCKTAVKPFIETYNKSEKSASNVSQVEPAKYISQVMEPAKQPTKQPTKKYHTNNTNKPDQETAQCAGSAVECVGDTSIGSDVPFKDKLFPEAITDKDLQDFVAKQGVNGFDTDTSIPAGPGLFVLDKSLYKVPLPSHLFKGGLVDRQKYLVESLNQMGYAFKVPVSGDRMDFDGFKVTSVDEKENVVFITQDNKAEISKPYVQRLIQHFESNKYMILVWLSATQQLYGIVKSKEVCV
jgi:hypothetical protein